MTKVGRGFLIILGVGLCIESVLTPGFQIMSSAIGGGLVGWNLAALIWGE